MASEIKIWERQKGETDKAYSAFKVYLEMKDRSIKKVAEKLSVSVPNVRKWASKFDWDERIAAYDSSIVEATRKSKIKAIKNSIERKNNVAGKLEDKALSALEQISLSRISARGIVEMLTLANMLRNEAQDAELSTDENEDIPTIIIKRAGE